MKSKDVKWTARARVVMVSTSLALVVIAGGGLTRATAGNPLELQMYFTGLLNDYTPSLPLVKGGPYEMRGTWWLQVDKSRGRASFSAALNMETSDYGIFENGLVDPTKPMTRSAHTHHISMSDGVVSQDEYEWTRSCSTLNPPVNHGLVITGTAYVTGNGGPPPFANPTPLTICILGGDDVKYSNITLQFAPPEPNATNASSHFGQQAIHGVVLGCSGPADHPSRDCTVSASPTG